jgi:putative FmdB family regulatory protein
MPTYEYVCSAGHRFERFQRMSEAPVDKCPECSAPAERLLSAGAGLLFKGSGFYITDYRSDSYKKAAEADSGSSSSSARGGSDKGGSDKGSSDKGGSDKGGSSGPASSPGSTGKAD